MAPFTIPFKFLQKIKSSIEKYHLIKDSDRIVVAFSGGKDSTFTLLSLRELGYRLVPVTIDMGYQKGWGKRVSKYTMDLGFEPVIIKVPKLRTKLSNYKSSNRHSLQSRLQFLDEIQSHNKYHITPCTECYNIKLLFLSDYAYNHSINTIAFGHHGTDAIVSLLKSAFYYIDRWEYQNLIYNRKNYESIVETNRSIIQDKHIAFINSCLFATLSKLSDERVISTDEPPKTISTFNNLNNILIRPLFDVFEKDIVEYINMNQLATEGSTCEHGLTKQNQTPREMIHRRIMDYFLYNQDNGQVFVLLHEICKKGLCADGTLAFDARRSRNSLLGDAYKQNMGHNIKLN